MTPAGRRTFRSTVSVAALSAALAAGGPAQAQGASAARAQTDEQFVESLGERYPAAEIDRSRLARLFYGVAATLEGGKSTLQYLQSRLSMRGGQAIPPVLGVQYEAYSGAVERFQRHAATLLEKPASVPDLFRVMSGGLRSCADLDAYARLLEAYGIGSADLASALASIEACDRFRKAVFQPRVEGLVLESLADASYQRAEIETLRKEIGELEKLLEDLRRIDAGQR